MSKNHLTANHNLARGPIRSNRSNRLEAIRLVSGERKVKETWGKFMLEFQKTINLPEFNVLMSKF